LRHYLDTSAIIKLVVQEQGSSVVAPIVHRSGPVFTSRIAYPEARAALAAIHRAHRLDDGAFWAARTDLEAVLRRMVVVEVTPAVARTAGDLSESHHLRGFDAVHLASAVTVAGGECALVTWDAHMWQAARTVGLAVLPREQPDA
jgi:predicted nucleic acid-binding protein